MAIANSTNKFGVAKWIVDATAGQGTHTTIASALTDASSGDTIFIRTGTYTENLTLKAGVNLTAFTGDELTPEVKIIGKLSGSYTGTVTISNIQLQTNSDNIIALTGSAATVLNLESCYFNVTNAAGISYAVSNASSSCNIIKCGGDLGGSFAFFAYSGTGTSVMRESYFSNSAATTTASTSSAGVIAVFYCTFFFPWSISSSGIFNFFYTQISTSLVNATCLTLTNTSSTESAGSRLASGTATPLSIGSGCTGVFANITLHSSNANLIAGSGTITYSQIIPYSTAGTLTPTQTKKTNYLGSLSFDGGTNTLDTYVTGTFVPTVVGSTSAGTGTYAYQVGRYTRIGNIVCLYIATGWSAHTGTGTARLSTLPYTVKNTSSYVPTGSAHYDNGATQAINCLDPILNTTYCQLEVGGGAAGSYLAIASSTNGIFGVVNYET